MSCRSESLPANMWEYYYLGKATPDESLSLFPGRLSSPYQRAGGSCVKKRVLSAQSSPGDAYSSSSLGRTRPKMVNQQPGNGTRNLSAAWQVASASADVEISVHVNPTFQGCLVSLAPIHQSMFCDGDRETGQGEERAIWRTSGQNSTQTKFHAAVVSNTLDISEILRRSMP